ncbi:transcription factor SPEECHLESS [Silene latifolia]|uniref:transcription factor SPEECHLESS n=1 Tax=Silene latifolia TaxID=37657 RepID=UPI003D76D4C3
MSESMSSFFEGLEFVDPSFSNPPASPDNLFSIFDALEGLQEGEETIKEGVLFQGLSETELDALEVEVDQQSKRKRAKLIHVEDDDNQEMRSVGGGGDGGEGSKMSHIAVERNRRKQMNEHISVLRSLMPCFYVKRGDQASIIGGVVDYISELQQVLQSLEAKKQRKAYSEVLSPRLISSPRPSQVLSPRKPPLSPRLNNLPLSPRTPQPSSPYNIRPRTNLSSTLITPIDLSPSSSCSSLNDFLANELVANSKSPVAEVEVKFSGPNLLLKTVSPKIPGQVVKIVSLLEDLSLEILQISMSTFDGTMLNSFTIKIGIECQLSAEELAHQIQQTFYSSPCSFTSP